MMNRRERLMATIRGEAVDRPAVSFYELNGIDQMPESADPFHVYTHPSWRPLIELAREKTDIILIRPVPFVGADDGSREAPERGDADLVWNPRVGSEGTAQQTETHYENGNRCITTTLRVPGRVLTMRTRQDPDIHTVWTVEPLLKDIEDFRAWLDLPEHEPFGRPDVSRALEDERRLGEDGIVMIDTPDPLCLVAPLFSMEEYTVLALTEQKLFHWALAKCARQLYPKVEAVAKALPGRLWRIYGPEYASPPYLPPSLFSEYVVQYVGPMVETIHRHGGYARIHSHGKLRQILDFIAATGCMGLDPIEPPPQGDVELAYVQGAMTSRSALCPNPTCRTCASPPHNSASVKAL
ncbi:MAG: hypothetical protein KKD33_05865, partial [Verrucomicrobia bacterium]|nr:hypothetical protein [Verrucomicrobiota bacterium]